MKEKLAECFKMMESLGKEHIKFKYDPGEKGSMPFKRPEENRPAKTFILHANGKVDYIGEAMYGGNRISLKDLNPTDVIVKIAHNKLAEACREQAKAMVMERLINHQLKYNGLDFLIKGAACNPNLH